MGWDYLAYRKLLQSLLPKGVFWNRREGSILTETLEGKADELARIDDRIDDLMVDKDTRYTTEMLSDWEDELGLPDECSEDGASITERRQMVHAKHVSRGGLNAQYYIDMAAAYGYTATVVLYPDDPALTNIFHWMLTVTYTTDATIYFTCGSSSCGDYLSYIPSLAPLFCIAEKEKPAWTILHYGVDGPEFSIEFSSAFDAIMPYEGWDEYLIGAFDKDFSRDFDTRFGGAFEKVEFSIDFDRPE